jgi:DNA repair protein RadC
MAGAKGLLTPRQVYARLTSVRRTRQEHFLVFCLNSRGLPFRRELVSKGILNATLVHPREVFAAAILHNAASIIVVHNHPSGDTEASADDLDITARLVKAGQILGIEVADHVIVAEGGYTSLREAGFIN